MATTDVIVWLEGGGGMAPYRYLGRQMAFCHRLDFAFEIKYNGYRKDVGIEKIPFPS